MKRLLIAGCGDIGTRLTARLDAARWRVSGLRRNPGRLPPTIEPVAADLLDPGSLEAIDRDWDALVYQATPGSRDEPAYRQIYINGLKNLLARVRCNRLILVSSTAVYGQEGGEWVYEDSATEPAGFSGQILCQAERLAQASASESVVVRFSGIYGPGRDHLIRQLRSGAARCRREPPQWTNRIHVDDCAGVLAHVLELPQPEPVYCASDDEPAPRCEVLDWLSARLDWPAPKEAPHNADTGQGKRVANRLLLESGFRFRYPDYRTGYGELLK